MISDDQMYFGGDNEYICNPIKHMKKKYPQLHDLLSNLCMIHQVKEIMHGRPLSKKIDIAVKLSRGIKGK
jgi:hypothetical protein